MKKKVVWVVIKDGLEIGRYSSKKKALIVVSEVGGVVNRYVKEWA